VGIRSFLNFKLNSVTAPNDFSHIVHIKELFMDSMEVHEIAERIANGTTGIDSTTESSTTGI
jgi:hypothetical protein